MATEATHAIRTRELELAMPLIPAGARVMELGAGDGWQASQLSKHGFAVTAIDVAASKKGYTQYFPVEVYDGTTLPFPDKMFDAVYSSNVLEHVSDFYGIQSELSRVLKPNGIAVHCVPSASWRIWTTLGHPIYAARWVFAYMKRRKPSSEVSSGELRREALTNTRLPQLLRLSLLSPRHGEHGNIFSEHYLFSKWSWQRRFKRAGWEVKTVLATGLVYSGSEVFGRKLSIHSRTRLAGFLGSSSLIFVLQPS